MKKKDLSLVCGNRAEGKRAFQEVVFLALKARMKLNSIVQKAIGVEVSDIKVWEEEKSLVIGEFNSLRFEILKWISDTAVEVGNQVTIDELCNRNLSA